MKAKRHPKVLVIDDDESIRESIVGYLEDRLYAVSEAVNGEAGLRHIADNDPDLILCDLRMPEMDGLEVLRRIGESGKNMPVIVVSGTGEISDTVQALRLGAADFITKPIRDMDLLSHAVDSALEKKRLVDDRARYERDLEKTNAELREALERYEVARENLIEAKKMAALGDLVAGIAHEINTPIGTALTASTFLEDTTVKFTADRENGDAGERTLEDYLDTVHSVSSSLVTSMNKAANLVFAFKQIAVDHHFENKRQFELVKYLGEIIVALQRQYEGTKIETSFPADDSIVMESYPGALSVILNNLIDNSISHGFRNVPNGRIRIGAEKSGGGVVLSYVDNGKGMDEEIRSKVFDPFFTTRRSEGPGLGLSIVFNMVTQKLGGRIELESSPGNGVRFLISIPTGMEG